MVEDVPGPSRSDCIGFGPFLGRDPLAGPTPDTPVLPPEPLLALRDLLNHERFVDLFLRTLVTTDPSFRSLFPPDSAPVLHRFVRALSHVLVVVEESAGDEARVQPLIAFARHLGEDHRKLGLNPAHFETFGAVLARTLEHLAGRGWTEHLASTLTTAYRVISTAMLEGIDSGPDPARVGATVVDVRRPFRDVAIVRLLTDEMIDYQPGQYLSVQTPYAPAEWRRLSPTFPANPARQIEFRVRAVTAGITSGPLVRGAAVGDRWVLARPLGELAIDRGGSTPRDVLMVAGGTGVAPLRCLLVDMLRYPDNPRVHFFLGARSPGELHTLPELVEIAATSPWLTVQPVVENAEDPWWLGGESVDLPRILHRVQTGRLVDVVTGFGAWADRQVFVCGSPAMVRSTVTGMIAAGTPRSAIAFDPF